MTLRYIIPVPCDLHHLVLDVLSQSLLQGLCNHGDLIPVNHITRLSVTHSQRGEERLSWGEETTLTVTLKSAAIKRKPPRVLIMYVCGTNFLLGVSAKHLRDDVSTTVSQKVTTGSATCR